MIAAPEARASQRLPGPEASMDGGPSAGGSPALRGAALSWALALVTAGAVATYIALNLPAVAEPLREILEVLRS